MDFWSEFTEHCLQSPWMIQPHGHVQSLSIATTKVFVYQSELSDEAATMLGKMVAALNYQPDSVTIIGAEAHTLDYFEDAQASHKIVFFGNRCPGRFGEAMHWAGHQVVKTHSLEDLISNPSLKKETWSHLKLFAGL